MARGADGSEVESIALSEGEFAELKEYLEAMRAKRHEDWCAAYKKEVGERNALAAGEAA